MLVLTCNICPLSCISGFAAVKLGSVSISMEHLPVLWFSLVAATAVQGVQRVGEVVWPLGAPRRPRGGWSRLPVVCQRREHRALRPGEHCGLCCLLPAGGRAGQVRCAVCVCAMLAYYPLLA